jgi:hypothetical protein
MAKSSDRSAQLIIGAGIFFFTHGLIRGPKQLRIDHQTILMVTGHEPKR